MSHIILESDGFNISLNISPEGKMSGSGNISGSVYEQGNRFRAVEFKVGGMKDLNDGERDISISFPGTVSSGGNAIASEFLKLDVARKWAESLHDKFQNLRGSGDHYLVSVKKAIKEKDTESLVLSLAMTPESIDQDCAQKAIIATIESGLLGDLTSQKGLEEVSDNVFHAVYNAVIGMVGKDLCPLKENEDLEPNEAMAEFLREIKGRSAA